MLRSRISRSTLTLLVTAALGACGGPSDEEVIRDTFESYKQAVLGQDGAAAAELVSQETIGYYEEMGALAATAGADEIAQTRLVDQLTITLLRHDVGAERLGGMTGNEVFVYAVDEGLVDEGSVTRVDIGEISVEGDVATAEVLSRGQVAPFDWTFRREDDSWKLDLSEALDVANMALEQQLEGENVSQKEFVLQLVETSTGRAVPADIWNQPE